MKKKILFVIDNLNAGGAEKTLVTLLNKFDLNNYDVTLFLISKEGFYINELSKNVNLIYLFNLDCHSINKLANKVLRKCLFYFISKSKFTKINKYIFSYVINKEYDIYISFMEGISTKIVDLIAPINKKKIAWVHTDVSKYKWYRKYYTSYEEEKACYLNYDNIICVSKDALNGFEKVYFSKQTNKVIYNILDKDEILKQSNEYIELNGDFKVCCVGRLEKEKGQDRLIEAFSKLSGNNMLYIVGDGSERNKLEELAKKRGIIDKVIFTGFDSNPYKYIKNCDVVVSASRNEGFSLFVAESIILNKMVISTRCSGPIEILDDGRYGKLVNDEFELALLLKQIINNKLIIKEYEKLAEKRSIIFESKTTMGKIYKIL